MKKLNPQKHYSPAASKRFGSLFSDRLKDFTKPTPAEVAMVAAQLPGTAEQRAREAVRLIWECATVLEESMESMSACNDISELTDHPITSTADLLAELKLSPLKISGKVVRGETLFHKFLLANPKAGKLFADLKGRELTVGEVGDVLIDFKMWRDEHISKQRRKAALAGVRRRKKR